MRSVTSWRRSAWSWRTGPTGPPGGSSDRQPPLSPVLRSPFPREKTDFLRVCSTRQANTPKEGDFPMATTTPALQIGDSRPPAELRVVGIDPGLNVTGYAVVE